MGGSDIRPEEQAMRVGVPKEIKLDEYRVGLTPASVREYVSRGHRVMVERGAGLGIGANDDIYGRLRLPLSILQPKSSPPPTWS